jgi:hypothetical protein
MAKFLKIYEKSIDGIIGAELNETDIELLNVAELATNAHRGVFVKAYAVMLVDGEPLDRLPVIEE